MATSNKPSKPVRRKKPTATRKTPSPARARSASVRTSDEDDFDEVSPQASTAKSSARKGTSARAKPILPSAAALASAENLLAGLANMAPARLTSRVKHAAEQVMDWAGTAAEMAVGATAPLVKEPKRRAALERAGAVLRDARETAGMTANDVAEALDFTDTNLLDLAESGRIALPFEVILRLASLLARNDPIAFVMNLTRFYNPGLWKILEQVGIGKLALNVGREREFINIFRANDKVRGLKDDEFKIVLDFTGKAFDSAIELALLTNTKRASKTKA
jgi:plasmid maintenance system antidote protein VapI